MSSSWCRRSRPRRCRSWSPTPKPIRASSIWGYGLGSTPHILGESLKQATGIDIASIPYRGGDQARADLLGGRVHMNIAPLAAMLPLIQEGKVRALAFTGPTRSVDLPDVPTTKEAGFPTVGYDPDVWLGILGPPGTPRCRGREDQCCRQ